MKRSPVKVISKTVTIPTIIPTAMILMNQISENKFWDRSPKDNFLKKNTCLIVSKNKTNKSTTCRCQKLAFVFQHKNYANKFEKGHPRNISVKLFQHLIRGFKEEFLIISSCPYSINNPQPSEPCFLMIKLSRTFFQKSSPKEYFCDSLLPLPH